MTNKVSLDLSSGRSIMLSNIVSMSPIKDGVRLSLADSTTLDVHNMDVAKLKNLIRDAGSHRVNADVINHTVNEIMGMQAAMMQSTLQDFNATARAMQAAHKSMNSFLAGLEFSLQGSVNILEDYSRMHEGSTNLAKRSHADLHSVVTSLREVSKTLQEFTENV